VYLNVAIVTGKIIRGPYIKRYPYKGREGVLTSFRILHKPTHRTTFRHLKLWVKIFGKPAEMVAKHVKFKDWVLVQGSFYLRTLKIWKRLDSAGNIRPFEEVEIWGHTVDLLQRPWHDKDGSYIVHPGTGFIRVPIAEYERLTAFDEGRSRWDIPRHRATDVLDLEEVDTILSEEDNPEDDDHDILGKPEDDAVHDPGDEPGSGDLPGSDPG
jgi:hypothetical protein